VFTDEETQVRIAGVENPTVGNIELGDQILAIGEPAADHSLLARLILVRRPAQGEAEKLGAGEGDIAPPQL
jgi:hypothetical protein